MRDFRNNIKGGNKAQATTRAVTPDQSKILGLVERAADGDFEAFGEVYSIHLDRIYRYVFYQVRDKMTAEDITEEVFIKAWKAIGSCKGRGQPFSPWLYRIAHNHLIDNFRSQRKDLSIERETIDKVSGAELEMAGELERQELLELIARLPENQRQVIILKFIEGLDNFESGQIMDKSQGAIRVLQMRALAALRQKLSKEK